MSLAQSSVEVGDASAVAEARARAASLARRVGLDQTAAGALAIAVTEAGSNIVKHGVRGEIVLRTIAGGGVGGVEAIAFDHGPGMRNVADSMRDGYSTSGSPGIGLGALKRMTTNLDVWSRPGKGTVLRFEVWPSGSAPVAADPFAAGIVCLPKPGESECGDAWSLSRRGSALVVFVVDGLGHGPSAAEAARIAIVAAHANRTTSASSVIDDVHAALRPTRGAAAAAIVLDPARRSCGFCGVGNIAASVHANGKSRSMVSHAGILGHQARKIQAFDYELSQGALLIAHSDGVSTRWDLASYAGIESRHPALAAAALYRDHRRDRDDATVLALRATGSPP